MGSCNKPSSPCGSNTDSLIEKIRMEISKTSDEDMVNIKKLTIQASNKSREATPPSCPASSCDIDKKISDLECLIKQLQEELDEMYCASKRSRDCPEKYPPTSCNYEYEDDEPDCPKTNKETCQSEDEVIIDKINSAIDRTQKSMESASHRYPIILRDIGHVKEKEDKEQSEETELDEDKPTYIVKEDESDDNIIIHGIEKSMPSIGRRVSFDWESDENEKKEENPILDKDSITVMIAELRAEIDDTIHTLNKK